MSESKRIRMNILVEEVEHPELFARLAAIHNNKLRARTLRQLAHERLVMSDEKLTLSTTTVSPLAASTSNKEVVAITPQPVERNSNNIGTQKKTIAKLPQGFQLVSMG